MYLNKKIHLLSNAILFTALLRIMGSLLEGLIRVLLQRNVTLTPDMLNQKMFMWQTMIAVCRVGIIGLIFFFTRRRLNRLKNVVKEDDMREMRALQEEYLGSSLSTLSADTMDKLLQIWAVILTGAEIVYCISSLIYRKFTSVLTLLFWGKGEYESFVSVYNLSHGFKYLEMLTAILLGVVMTGIFLEDRKLKLSALMVAVLFLIAFGMFEMNTMAVMGREIGIVWTSVIFHMTETVGLLLLAIYMSRHYRGL